MAELSRQSAAGPYIVTARHPPEHDCATGWEPRWACAAPDLRGGEGR
jgi:hypothetical protein